MERKIAFLNPFDIAVSGQCFRMHAEGENGVEAIAGEHRVMIRALGENRFDFDCTKEELEGFWLPYFDCGTDYEALWQGALQQDELLSQAAARYPGLRILHQDPWETLCSFLLSQRKSIPAIRTCIETICARYGEEKQGFYAFPSPLALLSAGEGGLRACGAGYRAPYLMDAARRAAEGQLDFTAMAALDDETLDIKLREVKGVGVKVAACVSLFGFHRLAVWPVDVWIDRIIAGDYGGKSPFEGYGPLAGLYQQYLFLDRLEKEKDLRRPAKKSPKAAVQG